jgi:acyl-[acyl-carrier-protein]-phospholipid O-acyltransferase/long-chain-fatty-acid--[acyl-carrier-protein] ligase
MYGFSKIVAKDPMFGEISSGNLIKKSFVLSRILSRMIPQQETTGLLLPSGVPLLLFFLSLHWLKRLPALLNYSHTPMQMEATCKLSKVETIVTSKKFVSVAKLEKHIDTLTQSGIHIVYTDDISSSVSSVTKLSFLILFWVQRFFGFCTGKDPIPGDVGDSAVLLFTSGSEGTPKGVVLSHENLLHNVDQVTSTIPLQTTDKVFNALPMFHSFGLTGGTLMPILRGAQTLLYPSPLHYRIIPELVYNEASTILFGTPTFLSGYARKAHPYDFNSLRYIFSGAERLSDSVRTLYQEKFGIRVFEGYGATETAPVISVNTPFHARAGTVGRLVPGILHRLEVVPGIDDGGRLFVKGSNIMKGYFKIDAPGVLQPLADGWYDTGDIVSVDEKGFITIKGRAKRFAKIGGEMVSLTAIEQYLEASWSNAKFAVIAVTDERKGEKLILITTLKDASRELVSQVLRSNGCSELSIPKEIRIQTTLPLLGSGKVDIQALSANI